jgi:lipid-binding SYLF domain-containing protein
MDSLLRRVGVAFALGACLVAAAPAQPARAATAAEIDRKVTAALNNLYATNSAAKMLGAEAKGILVFPDIVKGAFIVGGQYGQGALRKKGRTVAYYNSVAASYGLQAGGHKFGYALFFMTDSALEYLDKTGGLEIGVGPAVTLVDEGLAKSLTTTTARSDVYAFVFDQKGLLAGLGIQGSKISRIHPKKQ